MDIAQIYKDFATEWTGNRVDFDHEYGYQCADMIRQWWYEKFGIGNAAGGVPNATDYWNDPPSGLLAEFNKVQTNAPQVGDVVILNFNHIGVSNGVVNDTTFQQLDQNGGAGNGTGEGADAIQIHTFERSQIMGVLRPNPTVAVPYTITATFPAKQIIATRQPSYKYDLNYAALADLASHVLLSNDKGTIATVFSQVHHDDGYDYYMAGPGDSGGYNLLDWEVYVPPAPTPPASPANITAPVTAPSKTPYPIVADIPKFASITDASNHTHPTGSVEPSNIKYYKFNELSGMVAITTIPGISQGMWINPADNVVAPIVVAETSTDVKASYKRFFPTNDPLSYRITEDYVVKDMVYSGKPITIYAGHDIEIYGTFVVNGHTYLRPVVSEDDAKYTQYYYGIPTTDINSGAPYLENLYDVKDRILYGWEKFYDKAIRTIEGIFKPKKQ